MIREDFCQRSRQWSGRTKNLRLTSVLLLSTVLIACSSDEDPMDNDGEGGVTASFSSIQSSVFTPSCTGCHGGASPSAGLDLTSGSAYSNLVGVGSSGKDGAVRVINSDADNSYLIQKLEGAAGIAGLRMPRNMDPLPAATIQTIRDWITAGALDN